VTLDASMGHYLDLVNSTKPTATTGANENYARVLMQLFTIGLYRLNMDGSYQLDASRRPISVYSQTDVRQFALALTGWTYPTTP
jgi:DNA phosphorothioation-dependent restriction protein DptG